MGQAVVDRKGDDEVISRDGPDCKRTDLVIEASEGEIDLPIANGGERLRAVHFGERQRERRILTARGAQHVRHDVEQRRIDRTESDAGAAPLAHVHDRRFQPVSVIEETSHRLQDLRAFPGQAGPLARALKQLYTQGAFQHLDLLTQWWLRHPEALGCTAEVTLFGDCHEIPEMPQQPEIYHRSDVNRKLFMDIF